MDRGVGWEPRGRKRGGLKKFFPFYRQSFKVPVVASPTFFFAALLPPPSPLAAAAVDTSGSNLANDFQLLRDEVSLPADPLLLPRFPPAWL